jgi:hypothetical protein
MDHTRRRTEERGTGGCRRLGSLVGLLLGAVLATACSDSTGPTQNNNQNLVTELTCPATQVRLCTDAAARSVAQDAASDGLTRSMLGLENAAARTAITERLGQLNSAIGAGNVTRTRTALADTRTAVEAARAQSGGFPGDAADLAAIELLLDYIASLVAS